MTEERPIRVDCYQMNTEEFIKEIAALKPYGNELETYDFINGIFADDFKEFSCTMDLMNKMMKLRSIVCFFFIFISFCGCKAVPTKPTFIPFNEEELTVIDPKSPYPAGEMTFLVANYKDNAICHKYIDSMALALGEAKKMVRTTFLLQLYKISAKTNLKNLKENPRDLDRYSNTHDHIFDYYWSDGQFVGRLKFKNGKLIEPNTDQIIVKDLP